MVQGYHLVVSLRSIPRDHAAEEADDGRVQIEVVEDTVRKRDCDHGEAGVDELVLDDRAHVERAFWIVPGVFLEDGIISTIPVKERPVAGQVLAVESPGEEHPDDPDNLPGQVE